VCCSNFSAWSRIPGKWSWSDRSAGTTSLYPTSKYRQKTLRPTTKFTKQTSVRFDLLVRNYVLHLWCLVYLNSQDIELTVLQTHTRMNRQETECRRPHYVRWRHKTEQYIVVKHMYNVVVNFKRLKSHIALNRTPMTELWDVTCHMGSHCVTCYPTQVNAPALTPARRRILGLSTPEGWKAELWLVIYEDGLPVSKQSPIQVVSGRNVD